MATENRPSGWYPDPSGRPNSLRWWDGSAWTGDFLLVPESDDRGELAAQPTMVAPVTQDPGPLPRAADRPVVSRADEPTRMGIQSGGPRPAAPAAAQQPVAGPGSPGSQGSQGGQGPEGDRQPEAPWPGVDRPAPVTPVQFEAVEPNRAKRRIVTVTLSVVLAAAVGVGGYLLGTSKDDKKDTAKTGGAAATAPGSAAPSNATPAGDPANLDGFAGAKLAGGQNVAGWQSVMGPNGRVAFDLPRDWAPQVDPKTAGQEARYVLNPYECTGRTGPTCYRAQLVQNRRGLSGGWSDLKSLVRGMGGELVTAQSGGAKPPGAGIDPIKERTVQIQGREAYLALWSLPTVAGKSAPASYCGVIAVKIAPSTNETAVMQICVDRAADAPPLQVMDQIANSMRISA